MRLGEINDSQREGWLKLIETFDVGSQQQTKLALFASDRPCRFTLRILRCGSAWPNSAFSDLGNGASAGSLGFCGSN